jgi:hypothetical protein
LVVDSDYIIKAAELLMLIALMLGQTIWRKILPGEKSTAGDHLSEVIFDSLCMNRPALSIRYSQFGTSQPILKQESNVNRRIHIINYALAHQLAGNEDDCKKVLSHEDWSDALRDFTLAVAVLKGEFLEAAKLMRKIGKQGELFSKDAYATWPLFHKFRASEGFLDAYKEIYGHPFYQESLQEREAKPATPSKAPRKRASRQARSPDSAQPVARNPDKA